MTTYRRYLTAFVLAVALTGCGTPSANTPTPVNSAQTQALNIDKTLADAINAAVKTTIAVRDSTTPPGQKLSQSTAVIIENWAKSAAMLDDQIATELGSSDPWPVQKAKILLMLPQLKVPTVSGLDPTAQAALAVVTALISQIQAQVTQ